MQFRGFVPDETKFQLLAAADIFALPSLHEAFGLVYLEAMHCGLPVIAARPGGQEDYLDDGRTGFLVPPDDPTPCCGRCERLVGDRALRLDDERAQPDRGAAVQHRRHRRPSMRACSAGWAGRCRPAPAPPA